MNASLFTQGKEAESPRRDQAYTKKNDDLSTISQRTVPACLHLAPKYRLLLREDNADIRLTEKSRESWFEHDALAGRDSSRRWKTWRKSVKCLKETWINPKSEDIDQLNQILKHQSREASGEDLLRRPEMTYSCQRR
ncbi:hypothetical protein O9929_21775 [Vibrio lentus]|nr:hypothetical protein [Vibrio lentus]